MTQSARHLTLHVKGMSCGHCIRAITEAIMRLDAQAWVQIDLPSAVLSVTTVREQADVAAAIESEGYEVLG